MTRRCIGDGHMPSTTTGIVKAAASQNRRWSIADSDCRVLLGFWPGLRHTIAQPFDSVHQIVQ